ncbi:MAG: hypothetical protein H6832_08945 [Planctomycetes bacterium]|nr:hypothetical protein [Planctomycetota bacterium]MCB9918517.1 hypothetical protein [Planctomycetota bacterium]
MNSTNNDDRGSITPKISAALEQWDGAKLLRVLWISCAALVVAGLVFDLHPHFGYEEIPLFHALFGFGAFVVIVALGAALRFVVSRPENYYEAHNGTEGAGLPEADLEVEPETGQPEDHLRV